MNYTFAFGRCCILKAVHPGSIPGQRSRSCMPQLKVAHAARRAWTAKLNKQKEPIYKRV